jgi:hypothetical protein
VDITAAPSWGRLIGGEGKNRSLLADKRTGKSKDEMRGSLHCATHDTTVSSFGRDDVDRGWGLERANNDNGNGVAVAVASMADMP